MRPLHYVLKIADRRKSVGILRDKLGMQVLRHEEFREGCKATCNGPYDGRWSKTMIGYGDENDCFVLEVVYNYGVKLYDAGNNLNCLALTGVPTEVGLPFFLEGRYKFARDGESSSKRPSISRLVLNVTNVGKSVDGFWSGFLGMACVHRSDSNALLKCEGKDDWLLELNKTDEIITPGTDGGRTAFAIPRDHLAEMQKKAESMGVRILTPLTKLDTPGKASVHVVILSDNDDNEVCLVDDEGFSALSARDEKADSELSKAIDEDRS